MRLYLSFLILLLIATAATGLVWSNFDLAREGDIVARAVVLTAAPLALGSLGLLGRIVVRVSALRGMEKRMRHG